MGQEASRPSPRASSSAPAPSSSSSSKRRTSSRAPSIAAHKSSAESSRSSPSRSRAASSSGEQQKESEDHLRQKLPEVDTVIKTAGVSIDKDSVEKHVKIGQQVMSSSDGRIITYGKKSSSSARSSSPSASSVSAKNKCWKLSIPHATFVESVPDKDKKILRAVDVDVHFPVFNKFVTVKSFRVRGSMTPSKLLALVQRMAIASMAFYIKHKHKEATGEALDRDITYREVHPLLEKQTTCALAVRPKKPGYHMYVL